MSNMSALLTRSAIADVSTSEGIAFTSPFVAESAATSVASAVGGKADSTGVVCCGRDADSPPNAMGAATPDVLRVEALARILDALFRRVASNRLQGAALEDRPLDVF
jgi:hypothetical protein